MKLDCLKKVPVKHFSQVYNPFIQIWEDISLKTFILVVEIHYLKTTMKDFLIKLDKIRHKSGMYQLLI